jgi:hypothetical protein
VILLVSCTRKMWKQMLWTDSSMWVLHGARKWLSKDWLSKAKMKHKNLCWIKKQDHIQGCLCVRPPASLERPLCPPDKEIIEYIRVYSSIFKVFLKNIKRICPTHPVCTRRNGQARPPARPPVTPACKPPDAQYDNPDHIRWFIPSFSDNSCPPGHLVAPTTTRLSLAPFDM